MTQSSPESRAERKIEQELFAGAVEGSNDLDHILGKFGLSKARRVGAWVSRFTHNSRHPSYMIQGPLTTEEIDNQELFWIKRAQNQGMSDVKFLEDKAQLHLESNSEDSTLYAAKVVEYAHESTLHGGISFTMAKVREKFWIPRLPRLAKRALKKCWGCKRFYTVSLRSPPAGLLPKDRTEGDTPFNVIGVDFAGPIKYLKTRKNEAKAYVVLYSCSLTHGVYLELLKSLEVGEFIQSLKRFISRRGRPSKVYSDNGKTLVAAAKWLSKVQRDESFNDFLCEHSITWQFNSGGARPQNLGGGGI